MSLSNRPDDTITSWRSIVCNDVYGATARVRRELDFSYYGHRPIEWVKEARDAADKVVSTAQGGNWAEFCAQVIEGLRERRERWGTSEVADPDGFGCVTLDRFITSLQAVAEYNFLEACGRLDAAAKEREAAPIRPPHVYQLPVELCGVSVEPCESSVEPRAQPPGREERLSLTDRFASWLKRRGVRKATNKQ